MSKHAYLIMAHGNFNQLKKLIKMLDDNRNDLFIHVDLNAEGFKKEEFLDITVYSGLEFITSRKVFWASYSLTNVQLDLLECACNKSHYKYYHLLSGMDLPIKTQDYIHNFLDNKDCEFIGIVPKETWYSVRRVKFYHPLVENRYYRNCKLLKGLDVVFEKLQQLVGVNRLKDNNIKIIDGWEWFSVTDSFARFVLSKRNEIEKMYRNTIASDEQVMQTLAYNSEFYNRLFCVSDLSKGSMRFIDWKRGRPYVWRVNDFDEIMASECLFSRKFDEKIDNEIVEMIYDKIMKEQKK